MSRRSKQFVARVARDLRRVGEVGLAFLMTAGVTSCGGIQSGGLDAGGSDGEADGAPDHRTAIEAAQFEGGTVEAAQFEGGVMDAGSQETGPVIEAAFDAGSKG